MNGNVRRIVAICVLGLALLAQVACDSGDGVLGSQQQPAPNNAPVKSQWHGWFPIPSGFTIAPGTPVTAMVAPYGNQKHLDLFVAGTDGSVYSTYQELGSNWVAWFPVGTGITVAPNQPVTAVWRGTDHLDLFVVGTDWQIHTIFWEPSHTWDAWSVVRPTVVARQGLATPGTPVTAVWAPYGHQPFAPPTHLDLFVAGDYGAVYSTFWEKAPQWVPWFKVGPPDARMPALSFAQPVSAVWHGADELDLFVVGDDGTVYNAPWVQKYSWGLWAPVGPQGPADGVALLGSQQVTALWAPYSNQTHLDLFMTRRDGAVYSTYGNLTSNWQPWFPIHPEFTTGWGTPVTALWAAYAPQTHLDLFVAGSDGAVYSSYWEQSPSWVPWFKVGTGVTVARGQTVNAVWEGTNQLNLFVVGTDGIVHWAFWSQGYNL